MTKCAHCNAVILFGAVPFEGKLYCGSCRKTVEKRKHYAVSGENYSNALERLKSSPRDPALRVKALELGRLHASWGRHLQGAPGILTFDEVALSNDIEAACAAASAPAAESVHLEARLSRLKELLDRGVITEVEHRQRRQEILAEI